MKPKRKPAPVTVYMPDGGIQVRSARSFQKPKAKKQVRLTREIRSKINKGEHPRLTFPVDTACPVEAGDVIQITPLLWIGITTIGRALDHWAVDYIEHNERPRFLRARTHAADFDAMKERNKGKTDVEKDLAAAEESSYTTSTGSAMNSEPEAVPREYADQLAVEARAEELRPWEASRAVIEAEILRLEEDPTAGKRRSELRHLKNTLDRMDGKLRREAA